VIRDAAAMAIGELITTRLATGSLVSRIERREGVTDVNKK
jgi:hypothetical protein